MAQFAIQILNVRYVKKWTRITFTVFFRLNDGPQLIKRRPRLNAGPKLLLLFQ